MNYKSSVITRKWHGRINAIDAQEYLQYLIESGIADYKSVDGILSVEILRRFEDDICHVWTVTKWKDYESIKTFAGKDYTKAKYYARDTDFLLEFEEEVQHFETFVF
ncbi:antibiotic biosynthesis monooxygenase [Aquimarina sp. MAR_2010_214]|uniref:antibiotic biosynthesis monooxygenase n=1 Tax=Aquimarina sp. MAR_2010_214 TaxID=1250026 RepID=UPI000C6FE231|nr:antibiotic biosynthesis monooxygenase [Aquimarina sp. MAR_2010_214]